MYFWGSLASFLMFKPRLLYTFILLVLDIALRVRSPPLPSLSFSFWDSFLQPWTLDSSQLSAGVFGMCGQAWFVRIFISLVLFMFSVTTDKKKMFMARLWHFLTFICPSFVSRPRHTHTRSQVDVLTLQGLLRNRGYFSDFPLTQNTLFKLLVQR